MRMGVLFIGAGLLLAASGSGWAGAVNCKQVNKYLQTGRSVKDIAETMVIEESDVKKCQEEAAAQGGSADKSGGEKQGQAEGK